MGAARALCTCCVQPRPLGMKYVIKTHAEDCIEQHLENAFCTSEVRRRIAETWFVADY